MGRVGGSHGRKPRAGVGGLASRRSVFRGELTGALEEEETRNGGGLASVAMQVSKRWHGDGKFELSVVEKATLWT